MHEAPSKVDEEQDDVDGQEQFPVDTRVLTKVQLDTNGPGGDLLRIVVTNDQETSELRAHEEYNYGNTGASIEDVTSFTMRCASLEGAQQAVDAFVGSFSLHLETAQTATWFCGIYSPSAARKRLYKAVDPDDSTRMIGVLIEQDAQGKLVQLTWYKTTDTGTLFRAAPGVLDFDLVKDENNTPSLDPNNIGGWTWYYATSSGSS